MTCGQMDNNPPLSCRPIHRLYSVYSGSTGERKMAFTAQELNETASELKSEIERLLSKPTEPDVLLGTHPICIHSRRHRCLFQGEKQ
jgi:hypothetical protein